MMCTYTTLCNPSNLYSVLCPFVLLVISYTTYSCLHLLIKLITTYVQSKQAITCSTDHINNTVNYIGVYIPLSVCSVGVYPGTNGGQVHTRIFLQYANIDVFFYCMQRRCTK